MKTKKILALAMAAVLLVAVSVAGTLAYLVDFTTEVKNTFSTSEINVDLIEHDYTGKDEDKDGVGDLDTSKPVTEENDYQIIPGMDMAKDPTLSASSDVDYWVFVKVDIDNWPANKVSYTLAFDEDWDSFEIAGGATVYWTAKAANDPIEDMSLLVGDVITVDDELTKEELAAIKTNGAPKMAFEAFACQQYGFDDAEAAWTQLWAGTEGAIQ